MREYRQPLDINIEITCVLYLRTEWYKIFLYPIHGAINSMLHRHFALHRSHQLSLASNVCLFDEIPTYVLRLRIAVMRGYRVLRTTTVHDNVAPLPPPPLRVLKYTRMEPKSISQVVLSRCATHNSCGSPTNTSRRFALGARDVCLVGESPTCSVSALERCDVPCF